MFKVIMSTSHKQIHMKITGKQKQTSQNSLGVTWYSIGAELPQWLPQKSNTDSCSTMLQITHRQIFQ